MIRFHPIGSLMGKVTVRSKPLQHLVTKQTTPLLYGRMLHLDISFRGYYEKLSSNRCGDFHRILIARRTLRKEDSGKTENNALKNNEQC